ncbi:MAG: S1C family serine protease [Archangium sp.]|nr:S1C family serine protease [Archangium sp.]MDP3575874.1 S1C family serine protease [Archangium sp.]
MTGLAAAALLMAGALDSRALFERVKPSVVQIQVLSPSGELRSLGSGFVASGDGLLITNHHVIEGASRMVAIFGDGQRSPVVGVMHDDPDHDIAVVRVDRVTTPLSFGSATQALVGDEVMLIGSPYGLDFTVSVGAVARYRPDGLPLEMRQLAGDEDVTARMPTLQLTAPAGQGNSGGPVLSATGAVLGIVQSGIGGHGNFTFAVPSESLQAALEAAKAPVASAAMDGRIMNGSISVMAFGILAVLYGRMRRKA